MKILAFLFWLFPFLTLAQAPYSVTASATQLEEGAKVYLVYPEGDRQVTDSTWVKNGGIRFEGQLEYPVMSRMFLHKNPYAVKLIKGEQMDYLIFYLEPSQIELKITDSIKNAVITGSPENAAFKDLKSMLKPTDNQYSDLRKEYEALPKDKQNDSLILADFIARENEITQHANELHLIFAKKYSQLFVGLNSLAHVASNLELSSEIRSVYSKLPARLKDSPTGKGVLLSLSSNEHTRIGALALDFVQKTPDGKLVKLSSFKGKYVLVDFWASWCGPCRDENPNLVAVYQKYKLSGFEILGVSLDQPGQRKNWLGAIEKDELTWTQVSDLKGWENEVGKAYGIRSIPANFLIDPFGKIIAKDLKGKDLVKMLERIFSVN